MEESWDAPAQQAWQALHSNCTTTGSSVRAHEPGRRRRVALWPFSQFLWLLSVRSATGSGAYLDHWWKSLDWYRDGAGYLDNRPRGRRYFDDNAWVGLVAAQQWQLTTQPRWRDRTALLGRFLLSGVTPSGGVRWVEGGDTLNACSTGSAGLLFAVLANSEPSRGNPWRDVADRAAVFLHGQLLRSDGLIADHQRADSSVEPSVWSYNQGLAVALFDRTGHRDWSDDLIDAMSRGMPASVLHRQPAAFNAVWYRTLLARDPTRIPVDLTAYLRHAWEEGRDQRGLLSRIDRYDDGIVIDHSALTGLMLAVSAPPSVREQLL